VKARRSFAEEGISALSPPADSALFIAIGKCFSIIAYAQLVAENCLAAQLAPAMVSVIFHGLIEDLSSESLKLLAMFPPENYARTLLKRVVRIPRTSAADFESVADFLT